MRVRAFTWSVVAFGLSLACSPTVPGAGTDAGSSGGSGGQVGSGGGPLGSGGASTCAYSCQTLCGSGSEMPSPGSCPTGLVCCQIISEFPSGGSFGSGGVLGSGGNATGGSAGSGGSEPASEFVYDYATTVENTGTDCDVPELAESSTLPTIEKLPDPFTKLDGMRMTKKSEWRCRREEINAQAQKYIYGEKPAPGTVTGAVSASKVDVHVEAEGASIDFTATVVLPEGEGPFPAIINVGSGGLSLGESRIVQQGVAIIYYNHLQLGQEGTPEQSRGKPNSGKFYDIYGGDHSAGLLMAWSWGASRLIDVLQQADGTIIDVGKLGVTGCSRTGKGAFAIGVFDERIALTIPHETSTGGVPVYRLADILNQERTDHNFNGLNWLSDDFAPFIYTGSVSNAVKLPIDTHSLVAMIAPRGLLVLENASEARYNPEAGHLGTAAGAEVFSALGALGNVSYYSAVNGTHCLPFKPEYEAPLAASIAKFLKHESDAPGQIVAGQSATADLAEWKTWETPVLE